MGIITPLANAVRPVTSGIACFAKQHPTATKVVTLGGLAGAGLALAACGSAPRDSASLGAELIARYDRNGDGKLTIDTEGTREVPRSRVECAFPRDVNDDGVIMPGECDYPTTRTWADKYSIEPLLREANRKDADGDPNVATIGEIEAVMNRYDRHGDEDGTPADGQLQGDEQSNFNRDWRERLVGRGY